jgi:acetyltransferase-like isoleucine patch superfamily enzyme
VISYFKKIFFGKQQQQVVRTNVFSPLVTVDPSTYFFPVSVINRQNDNSKIIIGKHSRIYGTLIVFKTGKIRIGDYSLLNQGSYLISTADLKIGNRVLISWNVSVFDNNSHPLDAAERHAHFMDPDAEVTIPSAPVVIEDDVWIGCNCVILKGVTIGKGSIISAGSVVTKSIPPGVIAAGNPAAVIKTIS